MTALPEKLKESSIKKLDLSQNSIENIDFK